MPNPKKKYTSEAKVFLDAMNMSLAKCPPFPVDKETIDDPGRHSIKKLNESFKKGKQ